MKKPKLICKYLLIALMACALSCKICPAQAAVEGTNEECTYPTYINTRSAYFGLNCLEKVSTNNANRLVDISVLYEYINNVCHNSILCRSLADEIIPLLQPGIRPSENDNDQADSLSEPPAQQMDEEAVPQHDSQENTDTDPVISDLSYADEVVRLVNAERAKAGIAPLIMDDKLYQAATVRCEEIMSVFSHTRPDGSSCFTALQQAEASYSKAGENIAIGQSTPAQVVAAWMDSPGHRANILDPGFSRIGVAVLPAGSGYGGYAWAQFFAD